MHTWGTTRLGVRGIHCPNHLFGRAWHRPGQATTRNNSGEQATGTAGPRHGQKFLPVIPLTEGSSSLSPSILYYLNHVTCSPCQIKVRAGTSHREGIFLLLSSLFERRSLSHCSSSTSSQTWLPHPTKTWDVGKESQWIRMRGEFKNSVRRNNSYYLLKI
jgi:hypothetical protein